MSVEGKVVLATGSRQGIGLANDGADIALVDAKASQPPLPIVPARKVQDLSRQAH